jgi:tRNA (guanine-N7-)-methyltransferase
MSQTSHPPKQHNPPPPDLKPWFMTWHDIDADFDGRLDWSEFFPNDAPVEIDVGSGRGLFLTNAGLAHPDINFLGIEIDYKEGRRAAKRLIKREMPNARVLGGDVKTVFSRMIQPHSVDGIRVYFPDPWWKKKHRRRRVFNEEFVDLCAKVLKPDGLLHSWTDVAEYFEVISELMEGHPLFETLPPPDEREPEHDMDYETSYERKGRKLGIPISRGLWKRTAMDSQVSDSESV